MTSLTGVFLLLFSVLVVVFDAANFFAIGIWFFIMLIGIMLVIVGAREVFRRNRTPLRLMLKSSQRSLRSDANTVAF